MSSEEELSDSIKAYEEQLEQINLMISISPDDVEIVNLKIDLEQIISLTKESLLELKRQNLLKELDKYTENPTSSILISDVDHEVKTHVDIDVEVNQMIGTKFKVYYECPNSHLKIHNAMVLDVNNENDTVKIIFLNPTQTSNRICDYFLEGNCKFDNNCKYSHGYETTVDKLNPYTEPDINDIKIGKTCLAKYTDNVWYLAKIESIDENEICVQFKMFNKALALDWDDIALIDECEDETDEFVSNKIHDVDEDEILNEPFNPRSLQTKTHGIGKLGDWEKHTRGIGSKLLSKMGYIPGKGLGSKGEGMMEPIDVYVLPAGKSLDKIMELKEKRILRKEKFESKEEKHTPESDIFEFINKKLLKQETKTIDKPSTTTSISDTLKAAPSKNLNIQMLNIHNDIQRLERNIVKLKQSLDRNKNSDKSTIDHIKQKLQADEKMLANLKRNESKIQNERVNRKEKLDIF